MRAIQGSALGAACACALLLCTTPVSSADAGSRRAAPPPVLTTTHAPRHHGPIVSTTLTTGNGAYELRRMPPQYFVSSRGRSPAIVIDDKARDQRIMGFGGAMTDSSAYLLMDRLSGGQRYRALRRLFGTREGIGLKATRIAIGASDFTVRGIPYSYDDDPRVGQTCRIPTHSRGVACDPGLEDFSIAHDRAYIIPALREMLRVDPAIKLLASEWSPPPWMKANDAFNNEHGAGTLLSARWVLGTLADYFVKFLGAYRAAGVPVWAITPENEPRSEAKFPALMMPVAQEARFVAGYLRPALRTAGLSPLIFGVDAASPPYAEQLEHTPAASDLAGIAWHCYGGQQRMGAFHRAYPRVLTITSECAPQIVPMPVPEIVLSALDNYSSLVMLWNLALTPSGGPVEPPNSGCRGCRGIITVNPRTRTVSYPLGFYQLGQFSKFIHPGAARVQATRPVREFPVAARARYGVTSGLDDVAAVDPDGTRVLVVYDNSRAEQYFSVRWKRESFDYRLPPRGLVTFTWR